MDTKKVSFSFSKLTKKPNILFGKSNPEEKNVELIDCLEGQSIKIKDAVEVEKVPLIIPIKDNRKNLLDRIREAKRKEALIKDEVQDTRPDSDLTSEELAARELIKEARNRLINGQTGDESKVSVLPLKSETLTFEGEKEPTLEDYESIPVADYGLAVLRGMGWKEGMPIGKNVSKTALVNVPELRPKGLGLGASKLVQSEKPKEKTVDEAGKELILVKGSHAKIIAGGEKGNYCVVQGFDEDAGRVIVKVHPKGNILNVNEFILVPVTKEEFSKGSKVLNNAKYQEYKEISDAKLEQKQELSGSIKKERSHYEDNREKSSKSNRKKSDFSDEDEKLSKRNAKIKHERSRSRSYSKEKHRKDRYSESSDSEYHKKEKKHHKKSKSKNRDRSRSNDRYKRSKGYKSKGKIEVISSDSDLEYKSRKKESKHRSSSEEDSRKSRKGKY